jgi:hypothetical protein
VEREPRILEALFLIGVKREKGTFPSGSWPSSRWTSRFDWMKPNGATALPFAKERGRILWGIPYTRYPVLQPQDRAALVERVRSAVMTNESLDARTASLVGIAHATKLLKPFFDRRELRQ